MWKRLQKVKNYRVLLNVIKVLISYNTKLTELSPVCCSYKLTFVAKLIHN